LGAQIAPQQEREKKPPDSWKQVSHEDLFQHRDRFAASKSANKITNVAKSSLDANGAIRHKAFAKLQRLTGRRWLFGRKGGETQVRFLRCDEGLQNDCGT
jgi:hypothetical protein